MNGIRNCDDLYLISNNNVSDKMLYNSVEIRSDAPVEVKLGRCIFRIGIITEALFKQYIFKSFLI